MEKLYGNDGIGKLCINLMHCSCNSFGNWCFSKGYEIFTLHLLSSGREVLVGLKFCAGLFVRTTS